MVNRVRNSASPISTMLGGVSCMPSAWRSIDSTMMMRVKAVIATSIDGIRLRTVSASRMRSAPAVSPAPDGSTNSMPKLGGMVGARRAALDQRYAVAALADQQRAAVVLHQHQRGMPRERQALEHAQPPRAPRHQ